MITPKSSTDFVPYDCALVEMSEARSMNGHCSHGMILSIPWSSSTFYILHPTSSMEVVCVPILSLTAREAVPRRSLRPTARHLCLFLFVCFLLLIPLFSETDPVSLSSSSFNI
eukprot:scaffold40445_cov228-Skeletonema_dohrnii-CCMP3373.AAC.1